MRAEAEYLDELRQIGGGIACRQCQPDVLLDRAPGQKAGFLKYDAKPTGSGGTEFATEIRIEPGRDPQDRRLAASGRADQRAERSRLEPKLQAANDLDRRAVGRQEGLRIDAKFKRGGVASGLRVVQAVVPKGFRSPA